MAVRCWDRLPRGVFDAPSLEMFKTRLDRDLSNLIQLKMSVLPAGGCWTRWPLKVSSDPNYSVIL